MKKINIEICLGTSCYLLGAQDLMETIENLPQNKRNCIALSGVTCFKTCGKGPNVRVNGVLLSGMTPDNLVGIINDNLLEEDFSWRK